MKTFTLTPEEKARLERWHDNSENKRECDLIRALLLRSEGWTIPQISQALRLYKKTVILYLEDYKSGNFSKR